MVLNNKYFLWDNYGFALIIIFFIFILNKKSSAVSHNISR